MENILDALQNVENVADEILFDQEQIIDWDKKRNKNREALNAIKRNTQKEKKIWMCFGDMFIKTPIESAKDLITRDQNDINQRVNELRDGLKLKVNQLRELEGKEELKGFNLKPLNNKEVSALRDIL